MRDNFKILEAVYGVEAYKYIVEYIVECDANFTPEQAAADIVREEGFEKVLQDSTENYLSDWDRNSGEF